MDEGNGVIFLTTKTKMSDVDISKFYMIIGAVETELDWATSNHGKFHSMHEAYAVLLEEVDELWDVIKSHRGDERKEAVQVAAVAIRFIMDFCMEVKR